MKTFKEYDVLKKIDTGASSVEKYKIIKDGKLYILRLYDSRFMNSRITALSYVKKLHDNGIAVPNVYEYGILDKGFAILDWINGSSLEKLLVSSEQEIIYGEKIAKEFLEFHSVDLEVKDDLYDNIILTFSKKLSKVSGLDINKHQLWLMYDYFNQNKEILNGPFLCSIIHCDFHPGNIVVDNNDKISFIDLDVCKKAHPWEEFASNACNMKFHDFYSSVILNYFGGNVPDEFWIIYNLYGCIYVLDYILYSIRTEGKSIKDGISILNSFLDYNQNFGENKPTWFNEKINIRKRVLK